MHSSAVFNRFTSDQLTAMQWDDFEEDMSRCADYALIPDYDKLVAIIRGAAKNRGPGRVA
jgi:spermidine/putrescine transport system substrate-binding protein